MHTQKTIKLTGFIAWDGSSKLSSKARVSAGLCTCKAVGEEMNCELRVCPLLPPLQPSRLRSSFPDLVWTQPQAKATSVRFSDVCHFPTAERAHLGHRQNSESLQFGNSSL